MAFCRSTGLPTDKNLNGRALAAGLCENVQVMSDGWPDSAGQGESHAPERASLRVGSNTSATAPQVADHELLSCIGRGSYGEVWLARTVLGEFRAVKVIYRRAFEHDRPFEREFEGIRRFEPVSRAHPSQLNVLHVGRNDLAGYFYYVMELADDASAESEQSGPRDREGNLATSHIVSPSHPPALSPANYLPHTLILELHRHGRLPLDKCVKIGLALTTALEHLHEHGLVHRDIKPSNIIFVRGAPKLADIGLVATMDATMSFVGTSGFLPPEGPGTPQGDLYSLGKVLYEMAMGRNRQEFPKLPADLATLEDPTRLLELNAVILKACHSDPRQRYQSAKELAADLLLLQRGHSVRRLRTVERRLVFVTKAGAAIAAMLVVAATLYWNAARQARATTRQLYVADMNLAMQAWEGGNLQRARELLEQHRRDEPGLVGFEWRLLQQLCSQSDAQLTLCGHTDKIWAVAFSSDNQFLASASHDGTVKVWEVANGHLLHTLTNHRAAVHTVAFSPEGRRLASGGRDRMIRLWDARSGREHAVLSGHEDAVRCVAFSRDGGGLASAGEDWEIRLWDLATLHTTATLSNGVKFERMQFSPDGRVLAACGNDNRAYLWDPIAGRVLGASTPHGAHLLDVSFSPDGRVLATASYDGTFRLCDAASGIAWATLGRGPPVWCIAFAPHRTNLLATATDDGLVRLWDTGTRQTVGTLRGHADNVQALAFSHDGRWLATGGQDHTVKLWDADAQLEGRSMLRQASLVSSFAFAPDSRTLAVVEPDSARLWLWDSVTRRTNHLINSEARSLWCAAVSPDGRTLATGGLDASVRLWNLPDLQPRAVLRGHGFAVESITFSPDGRRVVSASRDGTLKVWDAVGGEWVATLSSHRSAVRAVAFSPDGKTLASGSWDSTVKLWNLRMFREVATLRAHSGQVTQVAFAPDGVTLASSSSDGTVRLWRGGSPSQ
jgi:WD40 repeat protein